MAAPRGGKSSSANVAVASGGQTAARARFPGRPCASRVGRLRLGKRSKRGRLCSDDGESSGGGPRPVNIGLAWSDDPALLRLLGLAEKHARRTEVGFESSEEEENLDGFATSTAHLSSKLKPPKVAQPSEVAQRSDDVTPTPATKSTLLKTPEATPIGKIVSQGAKEEDGLSDAILPPNSKEGPIGTLVPRRLKKEWLGVKGRRMKVKEAPTEIFQGQGATSKGIRAGVGEAEPSEEVPAAESAGRALATAVKMPGAASPPRPAKRARLSAASLQRGRRKKAAKDVAASPEIGAEAGAQSGPEAAMPLEGLSLPPPSPPLSPVLPEHRVYKRHSRKCLYGKRKKVKNATPATTAIRKRKRIKHVFYTYVTDPGPTAAPDLQASSLVEQRDSSTVTTARASRVIKTPKRFLDEAAAPFPKGHLSSWPKSHPKEEEKTGASSQDSLCDAKLEGDAAPDAAEESSPPAKRPLGAIHGSSHLDFYKKLKRLTLKLAEKKRGHYAVRLEDDDASRPGRGHVAAKKRRRRRKAKLTVEEMDSPGVVRRLAVFVNSDAKTSSQASPGVTDGNEAAGSGEARPAAPDAGAAGHRALALSGANKRMLHLLKKAKVQLIKIDQQKQFKLSQLSSSDTRATVSGRRKRRVNRSAKLHPQEQPLGGPRIKHVCRAAAVALGQPRATVPDDIPRLSALPLHEREGIAVSPAMEDVADDDDDISDGGGAERPVSQELLQEQQKQRRPRGWRRGRKFKKRKILSRYRPGGVRSRRCGTCRGCLVDSDCARCANCRDKTKFGGPNKRRQCCIYRRCERIETAKTERIVKQFQVRARQFSRPAPSGDDGNWGARGSSAKLSSAPTKIRKHSLRDITPRSFSNLLKSDSDEEPEEEREDFKEKKMAAQQDLGLSVRENVPVEAVKQRRPFSKGSRPRANKNAAEGSSLGAPVGFPNGFPQKGPLLDKTKIRVDFKEDCAIQNVWLMGGLSVLTSVPTTPQPVCLLCASKGRHEMVYCQICCEAFHSFCLSAEERPAGANQENWCCRRCKFCHVCGRRSKLSKPVLQCRGCQTSYHPSCLGPTYPKPMNCSLPWLCMTCIRCKSCGVTPGKSWEVAWNHAENFCPDCAVLHQKGQFCTVCNKCYDDDDDDGGQRARMIQCVKCKHWVHYGCEGLSEELKGLLSSRAHDADFTCSPCRRRAGDDGSLRERLQGRLLFGLQEVLAGLLASAATRHLARCPACRETQKTELAGEAAPPCDLQAMDRKLKGGAYSSIKAFHADVVSVMRKWLKEEADTKPTVCAREHYAKLMVQVFSWLPPHHQNKLRSFSEDPPCGMLPEAVIPPSKEHSYAQWMQRTYQQRDGRGTVAGKGVMSNVDAFQDGRQCALCQQCGDSAPRDGGRLLYLGQNEWAHINCCIWSAEVYENNGALHQVHTAVYRGRHLRCDRCGLSGATVGCCLSTCQSNFHFMCARAHDCVFQRDRKVYCYKHTDLVTVATVSGEAFEVSRRVYVDFEGITLKRKFLTGLEPESIQMTIGSLQIHKLGVLSEISSNGRMLYPVGYQCSRFYWSTVDPRRRCKYTCKVTEVSSPLPGEDHRPLGKCDQEENQTIVHQDAETLDSLGGSSSPLCSATPSPPSKVHSCSPGHKHHGFSQTRRPAAGSSRPLPSPGSASSKSHHMVTLRDLEGSRRRRRRSRRSPSPTDGGPVRPRCAHLGNFAPTSPPLSRSDSLSPGWGSPPQTASGGFSPRRGGRFEAPQRSLASSETEDGAAAATPIGISVAPDDALDASVLDAELEFDDTPPTRNALPDVEIPEPDSEDEHRGVALRRSVVREAARGLARTSAPPPAPSIPQLDGADDGSDSDRGEGPDEAGQIHAGVGSPTKRPTVALRRLESTQAAEHGTSAAGRLTEAHSPPVFLDDFDVVQSEEVPVDGAAWAQEASVEVAGGSRAAPQDVSLARPGNAPADDKDEASSAGSAEGFKDDDKDPDYSPEPRNASHPPMKRILVKNARHTAKMKRLMTEQGLPLHQRKVTVSPPPAALQVVNAATLSAVAAPLLFNGVNALNVQPAAVTVSPDKPAAAAAALSSSERPPRPVVAAAPAVAPTPQVLLVNSQGQILLKNPRSNTYQALNSSSPTYSKISQIARMLHKGGQALRRPLPRVAVKPSPAAVSSAPAPNGKIVYRVVPIRRVASPPPAVTVQRNPASALSEAETAQAILSRSLESQRDAPRTAPIILRDGNPPAPPPPPSSQSRDAPRRPAGAESPSVESGAPAGGPQTTPAPLPEPEVRVKLPTAVPQRRKRAKMDVLNEPSGDHGDHRQSRTQQRPDVAAGLSDHPIASRNLKMGAGRRRFLSSREKRVKIKMQPVKDVPDVDKENLRTTAPPLPMSPRPHDVESVGCRASAHKWVSARHADLAEWGPLAGYSSEDEAPLPKHKKRICMNQPHLRFEITSEDGFSVKADSIEAAWRAVIDNVQEARAAFRLGQLPLGGMSGPRVLGVVHDAVIFLLEQLRGAGDCKSHRFRFHRCDGGEEELPLNPSGCARGEVYTRKATFDMFDFLASQHRALPDSLGAYEEEDDDFPLKSSRRATSSELPMAMRFRHLEKTSKEAVGAYRSLIHGRGLFCKRNIEAGEMVIEYSGAVIRSVLTDKREKYYDGKGIGCYMFRIDDFDVVDATMQGNAARFINHSCEPNCYSRVINVDGRKHIVIFALRKIYRGEELTYDYKFPIEDDESKLRCNCGARRCRRYLN
ncbi:histone-lysine N-methyltransferase 2B [Hippocampus zosterae]|uniref:histone-lysine N-methyltransferase 2B n=1 Tax=Hippocampus zosterae TaxID=109293 RepID=UPI00223E5ABC|nr:histone-lysine N-methyltransferase 2B [Hippocampus zosterae]